MDKQSHKRREGIVYSTAENFDYVYKNDAANFEDVAPEKQQLKVFLDTKARAGKKVTIINGFTGKTGEIENLAKLLKTKCGVGGSCKDREIIIQGDFRDKIIEHLIKLNYKAKKI